MLRNIIPEDNLILRLAPVALLSASLLAYEVTLLRVFSIALWHHFAYLIISIAMLGLGASGTLLSVAQPRAGAAERWFPLLAMGTALAQIGGLAVAMRIPFEPFLIVSDPTQSFPLLYFYLLLGVPFGLGASAIALALITWERTGTVYFVDLMGAGVGALVVTFLFYYFEPVQAIGFVAATASIAAALASRGRKILAASSLAIALAAPAAAGRFLEQKVSPYKALSTTLLAPEARRTARAVSPLAVLDAVEGPTIRYAPGLSLNFMGDLPEQIALFADGDQLGVVNDRSGNLDYLDHMTSALPYHLIGKDFRALVLGAGGGTEVLSALYHGAHRVVAVEMDRELVRMVSETFGVFSGGIYNDPRVDVRVAEARRFVQSSREQFDIISISLLDSFVSAASGVHAASESYLYTLEALAACRARLAPGGLLAITRWIKTPPRDVPRLFSTLVEVLENDGVEHPGSHLAGIRSWATATVLMKATPFTDAETDELRVFCDERSFDRFWHAGLLPSETNQFHVLSRPFYAEAARELLSSRKQTFRRDYPFRLEPATDDSPYYFHFFRWDTFPEMIREQGLQWIPFVEWGFVILLAVLAQALVASVALLFLPIVFTSALRSRLGMTRSRVALFFGCLGLGYLFIQVALIQKFTLFLSHPVLSAAVVLSSMLVFSGLGSLLGGKLRFSVIALLAALVCIQPLLLPEIFELAFRLPDVARMLLAVLLIAPMAFLMGIPFPRGLERVKKVAPPLAPWAWAVNGFSSVLAPPIATLLAMTFGFGTVLFVAAGLYLLAGITIPRRHNP